MNELSRYKDWSPTALDIKGKAATDDSDWFVAPCMLTRDSDALERSNWITQQKALEGCPADSYHTLDFNHWACGWFNITLVRPDSLAHHIVTELKNRLEQHPVLDEELMSELEDADNE